MTALARPRIAVALLPLGLLLFVACNRDNTPDTGIIVEVSSDLRVPQDIKQVKLTATDPQGNSLYDYTYDLGNGANQVMFPFRVGLYPLRETKTPIHVEAVGQLDGPFVASRSATLSFVQGKKVVLPLPLLAVCKGVACKDASLTCQADGKCGSDTVDTKNLPPYVPNQPVPATDAAIMIPDAQTPVAPMDAAVEKVSDTAGDRARDLAPDVAGGRDAFFATGGVGGTDAPSATGGVIGTGGGTAAADARIEVGDMPRADALPDVPVGGGGGTGGTTATGGITASGGKTSAGGTTTAGGTTASGGTSSAGGTTIAGGTTTSGGTTSAGGTTGTGGTTTSGGTSSGGGNTTAGGATASGGTTSAGGTTTAGGTIASGGSGGQGSTWGGTAPSCSGLAATCGPSGNESCCTSLLVPGGTFYRSYDGVTYTDKSYPATVADFYLDKYEITVGRFRQFVNAGMGMGMGTQASPPASGAGVHPLITGSGWNSAWNTNLKANTAALTTAMKCDSTFQTWTDTALGNESRPQNCIDWYEAFAFCAWDGGRLATEAEWNYAAAGGSEQREYPWGSGIDASKASYSVDSIQQCMGDGVAGCSLADLIIVGSKPAGNGKWGHADLAGNVWEWTLDWYATYQPACNNCADLTVASVRVVRGGSFYNLASYLRSALRYYFFPGSHYYYIGARCARTSL